MLHTKDRIKLLILFVLLLVCVTEAILFRSYFPPWSWFIWGALTAIVVDLIVRLIDLWQAGRRSSEKIRAEIAAARAARNKYPHGSAKWHRLNPDVQYLKAELDGRKVGQKN